MLKRTAVIMLLAALTAMAGFAQGRVDIQPEVFSTEGVRDAFLFPVTGSVEGANGTRFRSEITLVNFRAQDQEVLIEFLEQGGAAASQHLTLEAGKFYSWDDFVATVIGRTERLGALRVRGVYAGTTVTDPAAQLNGFSRIWTPQPNGPGTSSLSISPIAENDLTNGDMAAWIFGMRQDEQYRVNVGIVNLANYERNFTVDVRVSSGTDPAPFTVKVPARALEQVRIPEGTFRTIGIRVTPELAGAWSAYGASVDNQSGDGWVSKAQYPIRQP